MSRRGYEAKLVRGVIVGTLEAYYPNGLSAGTIHRHGVQPVWPATEWEEVLGQIAYLTERGLLQVVGRGEVGEGEPARDTIYRLTAAGLDLATGVTQDEAVVIDD